MEANQILQSAFLDILFEGKNKSYGAYELRQSYNSRITKSLLIVITSMLVLIIGAFVAAKFKKNEPIVPLVMTEANLQKIKPEEIKVLPKPKLSISKPVATIKYPPPIIVKDPMVTEIPPDVKQLEAAKIDAKTIAGTQDIGIVAPPSDIEGTSVIAAPVSRKQAEDTTFTTVEIEAQFPGGAEAWQRYIRKAIMAQLDEFSQSDYGTCVVEFIVDKNGNVSDVKATTMRGTKLAEIAINTIRKGPNWTPAMQNGTYVNAWRIQPVTLLNPDQ
jgi:protein TonB